MGGPEQARPARGRERAQRARAPRPAASTPGTFIESGLFATSAQPAPTATKSPGDGKIAGFGKIDGRDVAVVSNDFTVMGASSGATNGRKIAHMKRVATQRGMPLVFLGESSGARMPDHMGSRGMGSLLGNDGAQYQRLRETPWASATLGPSYGSSSWYSVLSDFCVMRKGAVLAVSSPLLASLAISEEVDPRGTGRLAAARRSDGLRRPGRRHRRGGDRRDQALPVLPARATATRRRPCARCRRAPARRWPRILDLLPASRTQVYDVRKIVRAVVDEDSFFELKPRFGKVAVTGLARLDGRTVGIIANNPLHKGGALDADACEKITSFLVLCDSFNIPLVMLVDTPGFVIGTEAERRRAPGKIMNFMNALALTTVPKLSVILRKSYGQAYLNMGGGRNSDEVAAWPTAEVSFMDPTFAVKIVHGLDAGEPGFDEALRADEARQRGLGLRLDLRRAVGDPAPRTTRDYLIRMLDVHRLRLTNGVGQHLMRAWPTSY